MTAAEALPYVGLAFTAASLYLAVKAFHRSGAQEQKHDLKADARDDAAVLQRVTALEATHVERCKNTDRRFDSIDETLKCLTPMKVDIRALLDGQAAIEAYIHAQDVALVRKFHSPHTPEFDALLEALEAGTLDLEQAERLEAEAQTLVNDSLGSMDELAAVFLLGRARMVRCQLDRRVQREGTCQSSPSTTSSSRPSPSRSSSSLPSGTS